jgi:hypothetical protein
MSAITQAELHRCEALKAQLDHAEKELAGLRQGLLEKLDAGAQIEAGPLTAQVRVVNRRELNASKLVPVLGEAAVEELKRQVEPTVQRRLVVQYNALAYHADGQGGP